jgi:hypothetical protein
MNCISVHNYHYNLIDFLVMVGAGGEALAPTITGKSTGGKILLA